MVPKVINEWQSFETSDSVIMLSEVSARQRLCKNAKLLNLYWETEISGRQMKDKYGHMVIHVVCRLW